MTDDVETVREMALAGCTGVFVGFESLHPENIVDAKKKSPRPDDYARRVRILHDNGIQVNGSFVLGFDHDGPDVFERTAEWIEANRLECATFHIMTPYPATPLFRQMEAEGRLLHRDWSKYDTAHVVFRPKHMTVDELAEGYAWCYRRLFSLDSILAAATLMDARGAAVPRDVDPLQAIEPALGTSSSSIGLTGFVWRPLVELRRGCVTWAFAGGLAERDARGIFAGLAPSVVSAGV